MQGSINQDLIQLKQSIDIIALAQSYNLAPKRQGQNWLAKCPFHVDQTASLSFTPSKGLYHCFGCGAAGSVIDLVMQMEGLSFHQAVEKLKQDYGLPNGIDTIDAKANKNNSFYETSLPQEQELLSKPTKLKEPLTQPEIYQLRELYVKLSKEALMQTQEGSMYLVRRGLFSQALRLTRKRCIFF